MITILGITFFLIFLLMIMIGYLVFVKKKGADLVPTVELFLIGFTYMVLLLLILSITLGEWSAISSLATVYLLCIAPVLMGTIAYCTRNKHQQSAYYKWTYVASLLYFVIIILTFIIGLALS